MRSPLRFFSCYAKALHQVGRASQVSLMLCVLAVCMPAQAHDYYAKLFHIFHPWAEPTEPGVADTDVYVKFDEIMADDKLVGAKTLLAERVELRGPVGAAEGDPGALLPDIALAPGTDVELRPGTSRLVLKNLRLPLAWGRSYPMTLEFEKSGVVFVMVSVGTP